MSLIKVLLADDHQIVRDGIISILHGENEIVIVGEASNGCEVLNILDHTEADVVIMDISMPQMDGIECLQKLKYRYPGIGVLVLSMFDEERYVTKVCEAGANGYILKDTGKEELVRAIKVVFSGKPFYSSEISQIIIENHLNGDNKIGEMQTSLTSLSSREREVLTLILEEYANHEIADRLFISRRTVDTHKRNLLKKTKSKNITGLIKFALQNQLLDN